MTVLSCGKIKRTGQEVLNQSTEVAVEHIEKVLPTYNAFTADTENNKHRYKEHLQIELTKDANGGYILANPLRIAGPTLWGRPVVETEIPAFEGEFLAGAFRTGAQIFDREDANVVVSTENADDFEKNLYTMRCEERLALANKRPGALIYGDFGEVA